MVFLLDSTLLVHLVTNKKACKSLIYKPFRFCALYRERDLNPHSHHWPKDFKSFVSTDSTIAAQNRLQRYNNLCIFARKNVFFYKIPNFRYCRVAKKAVILQTEIISH